MNAAELRAVVEANEVTITQYELQLQSLRELSDGNKQDIEALRRGDDLRQILIALSERRQVHFDRDIRSVEEVLKTMRANQKMLMESTKG
jgi:hypothetical protein